MARVEIYTTPTCPYCMRALALLQYKGVSYTQIDVSADPAQKQKMIERAQGRRTVPQIFINNHGIGGCDDLHDLENKGQLDALLNKDIS